MFGLNWLFKKKETFKQKIDKTPCIPHHQLESALHLILNYSSEFRNLSDKAELDVLAIKRFAKWGLGMLASAKEYFTVGAKVICKGNEPDIGYWVGEVTQSDAFSGKHNPSAIPMIKNLSTGVEFINFGITVPYNENLLPFLNSLNNEEQYDFLRTYMKSLRVREQLYV